MILRVPRESEPTFGEPASVTEADALLASIGELQSLMQAATRPNAAAAAAAAREAPADLRALAAAK